MRVIKSIVLALVIASLVLTACATATTAPATTEAPTSAPATTEPPTSAPATTEAPTSAPATTEAPTVAATPIALPPINPADYSGDIVMAGSSTVYPVSERMVEQFNAEGFEGLGTIKLDSVGSGAGFERFCVSGETDISNASRAIKDSEVASCEEINRTPIAFRIGTDAIAIVVNKSNTFVKDVTLEELGKIFSSDATKWSDVRPDWPAEDIHRYAPGTDSGTFDFFVEFVSSVVYGTDNGETMFLNAANLQASEDDNVLVQGVAGDQYAIGFFGFAYFAENEDKLNVLSVNGVAPSYETAENNTYPLSRPLFIYSDAGIMNDKPQVAAFISYYLTNVSDMISSVGYFPASTEAMNQAKQAWLDATAR